MLGLGPRCRWFESSLLDKHPCSSIGRTPLSKSVDEGSSPYMGAIIPEWWNGIHSGLRNRVERRVGSSPTLGTYCPLV